jgi:hypothetical protein
MALAGPTRGANPPEVAHSSLGLTTRIIESACSGCNDFMPYSANLCNRKLAHLHLGRATQSISIVDSGEATCSALRTCSGKVLAMHAHRFRDLVEGTPMQQPQVPTPSPCAFMACPVMLMQTLPGGLQCWQMAVYQLAFEQAQAAQQPAQSRRDLQPSLN